MKIANGAVGIASVPVRSITERAGAIAQSVVLLLLAFAPITSAQAITALGSAAAADNGGTVTVSRPTGTEQGDIIIAQVAFRGDSSDLVAPPLGWSAVHRTDGSGLVQVLFYKFVGAADPDEYTWSVAGRRLVVVHSAYRGVDPSDPIDAVKGQSGSGDPVVAPSVTTSQSYTRLIGAFAAMRGGNPFDSGPSPMTVHQNLSTPAGQTGTRALLADEMLPDDGTSGAREAISGVEVENIGALVALRRAPSGEPVALEFSVHPSETTAGQVISPAVEVQVVDEDGALVTDSSAEITVAIEDNPAGGTLAGTTTIQAVDGVATFEDLSVDEVGNGYTLSASGTDLDGDISDPFDIVPPKQEANAFDPDTPAGKIIGDIGTRVAGAAFDLDIVAIDGGEVDEYFDDTVEIYLLNTSDNSGSLDETNCRDSWERIRSVGMIDFDGSEGGRTTLTGIEEPESWRQVRVEIERTHPPGQSGVIGCSNDAFAIRPDALVGVVVSDGDRDTAGTDRLLDNASPGGDPVHTAGAPFTVTTRAINANGDTTENYTIAYDPSPVGVITCLEADEPCNDGVFEEGSWNEPTPGSLRTDSATHDEVGAFELILEDRDFASIDSGGSSEEERFVRSATLDVGRFVPADFAVAVREGGVYAATCDGAFTYIGAPFAYTIQPRLDIAARNASGDVTVNYRGQYNMLAGNDVAVAVPDSDASAVGKESGTTDVAVDITLVSGTMADDGDGDPSGNGVIVYTFASSDTYRYEKVENARIGPFEADLPLEITNVTDGDGVTDAMLPAPFTPAGAELRFGRLIVDNAGGAEIAPIDVPLRAEYWTGATWYVNGLDSCTALALDSEIELTNGTGTVSGDQPIAVGGGQTGVTTGDPVLSGGTATITFSAPGAENTGWVDVSALLTAGALDLGFLQGDPEYDGDWTTDPVGRVTFGIHAGSDRWLDIRRVPVQ